MVNNPAAKILLSGKIRDDLRDDILQIVPGAKVILCTPEQLEAEIDDATIVAATRIPDRVLAQAKRLEWVHTWAAGPDEILTDTMKLHPAVITSCRGNGAIPLAEHAMMLMLMLDREAHRALQSQSKGSWDRFYHGELNGKTCGIIGAGNSGADLAQKAQAFHMRTIGLRRTKKPTTYFDEMYDADDLDKLLAESDFLVVGAALTTETRHMLGTTEFRKMKKTAFYICYSRGAIADPTALETALTNGWIAGAGLDAHAVEPLPPQSPFWSLSNVIVTAHMGALSPQTRERGYQYFLENLRRYLSGAPMLNLVGKNKGY